MTPRLTPVRGRERRVYEADTVDFKLEYGVLIIKMERSPADALHPCPRC